MKRIYSLALLACASAQAEISVMDISGVKVTLAAPARRIVSLAPHITELAFAAGAGDRLVGNVEHGSYPPAAKTIPSVGGYSRLDLEAIVALKPDLVLAWESGNAPADVAKLRSLGLAVYLSQPNRIIDVAAPIS